MPIDPDGWEDIGPEEGWEDIAPTPTFSNPAGNAWKPSASRVPRENAAPSLSEKIQRQSSGFAGGLASELPNVAKRFAGLGSDILQGWKDIGKEKLGIGQDPASLARSIKEAEERNAIRRKFEEESAPAPNENLGASLGRFGAKAVPQLALAAATGGTSVPAQAAAGGSLAMLQGLSEGATPGEATFQATLGAAAPYAGGLASKVGGKLKKAAIEQYYKALNPTRIATKRITEKIVPELLERGVTGNLDDLASAGARESSLTGEALETAYGQSGQTVNATKIADDLESLKAPFQIQPGQVAAVGPNKPPVIANPGAVNAIENIQSMLRDLGDNVAPDQLWKFRQNIDDLVSASNGFQRDIPGGTIAGIAKKARADIQRELTAAVPDVARLNAEYSLWQGLEDVARATAERKVGQQGAAGMLARTAGGAVGGAVGSMGGPAAGIAGAAAGQQVSKSLAGLMSSPAWRTVSAVQKYKLAQLLTSGKPDVAARYIARLAAPAAGSIQNRPTSRETR